MLDSVSTKASRSLKSSAATIANVAPRYETPPSWLPGVRVLLAFYAPLLLGLALGNVMLCVPVSIGAVIISFVDPLGSSAKRFAVSATVTLGCVAAFLLGTLVGGNPVLSVLFVVALIFVTRLAGAFGSAAMRGSFWIVSVGLYGIESAGISPGYFSAAGLFLGGLWAIFLSLITFRERHLSLKEAVHPTTFALQGVSDHLSNFLHDLPRHLALKTALGRSAARTAVAAGIALVVAYVLDRPSAIWITAAVVAILNPQIRLLKERSARLLFSTALGTLAAIVLVLLVPSAWLLFLLVAPFLFLAANLRTVNYAMWVMLYTAFAFTLLFFGSGLTESQTLISSFDAKIIDTAIGTLIALIVAWVSFPKAEKDQLETELTEARLKSRSCLLTEESGRYVDSTSRAAAMPAANETSKNVGSSS